MRENWLNIKKNIRYFDGSVQKPTKRLHPLKGDTAPLVAASHSDSRSLMFALLSKAPPPPPILWVCYCICVWVILEFHNKIM